MASRALWHSMAARSAISVSRSTLTLEWPLRVGNPRGNSKLLSGRGRLFAPGIGISLEREKVAQFGPQDCTLELLTVAVSLCRFWKTSNCGPKSLSHGSATLKNPWGYLTSCPLRCRFVDDDPGHSTRGRGGGGGGKGKVGVTIGVVFIAVAGAALLAVTPDDATTSSSGWILHRVQVPAPWSKRQMLPSARNLGQRWERTHFAPALHLSPSG